MTNQDLPATPQALADHLRPHFPHLAPEDTALGDIRGGRTAALAVLAKIDPPTYERTRNFLSGDITRLSPYLRHGILTLAEVRDHALKQSPTGSAKLINEFAWRDYWQRLYVQLGERIWQDREPCKTGFHAQDYAGTLPPEVPEAQTTLVCMDSFARQLHQTGYLHNHARMWFAAYLVHWRRIRWQAGARWFLQHLLDGDPASNNLSWQWVASTFSAKPYLFNRENLERYTDSVFCRACPHASAGTCPFDSDYDSLTQQLFPRLNGNAGSSDMPAPPRPFSPPATRKPSPSASGKPLLWIHTDSLNPAAPMFAQHPGSPAVFLWDTEWLTKSSISLKRIVFLAESLREFPNLIELRAGDPATELLAAARAAGADYVLAQRTPDPRLLAAALAAERHLPVVWIDPPAFAQESRTFDLKRFSRYWQKAQGSALQTTPAPLNCAQPAPTATRTHRKPVPHSSQPHRDEWVHQTDSVPKGKPVLTDNPSPPQTRAPFIAAPSR